MAGCRWEYLSTPQHTTQHTGRGSPAPADPTATWSITPSPLMSACSCAGARCSLHNVRPVAVAAVAVAMTIMMVVTACVDSSVWHCLCKEGNADV